jgi:hypothetical protein
MDTNAQVPRVFGELTIEAVEATSAIDPALDDADAVRRSENNILQWMKYLPEDCVSRMIEMRWDVTT